MEAEPEAAEPSPPASPTEEEEMEEGEDDDEDHAWAVRTDAPEAALDLLCEEYDGWLDAEPPPHLRPPLDLPAAPKRHHRPSTD